MLISLLLVLQALGQPQVAREPLSAPVPIERQILWQRSLEDALALSKEQARPILIAVNMDGESASERIVRERYRDPRFVALTRRFVCLGSTGFRHGLRDHDFDGRRLLSPRLGEVTSGEAMALEPILFDKYLGGERIAPRHALILPDGRKEFDLFLLFDLSQLDQALEAAQQLAPHAEAEADTSRLDASGLTRADWLRLSAAKDNRQRARFEALLFAPTPPAQVEAALRALLETGDAGSCEALRIAFARCGDAPQRLAPLASLVARVRGIEAPAAAVVRELVIDTPASDIAPGLGARAELLDSLWSLGGSSGANRSLIVSYAAAGEQRGERERVARLFAKDAPTLAQAIDSAGGAVDPARVLAAARAIAREAPWSAPDELAPVEEREAELAAADELLSSRRDDPAAQARFGRAALAAARGRIETQGSGIDLLLGDARAALGQASKAAPSDVELALLLARTSYLLSDFEGEERAALAALAALPPLDPASVARLCGRSEAGEEQLRRDAQALQEPRERLEALRWLADASARQLATRSGGDPALEAAGMARGFTSAVLVALAPVSTPTDWLTLSAFHAALGRRGDEIAVARQGLEFFPDSTELRNAFYLAMWDRGYVREARRESEVLAGSHPDSSAARWYVGYAAMQEGNSLRRAEDPRAAIEAYSVAEQAFAASAAANPAFQDSSDYYRALAALGRGFAHLLVDERGPAAAALVEAIAIRPSIAEVRDPLDREAVDLLDAALEWRASGPSPVDPLALARELAAADPGNTAWARRISDSELREGLRADGRGERALGDAYLTHSIAAARLAVGETPQEADVRALAQALAVMAERRLALADVPGAAPLLGEAAELLLEPGLSPGASDGEWIELAARLRDRLGEARPVFRPGR